MVDLLAERAERVAEGFGSQMEQSLQEHVNLQRVETLTLIWTNRQKSREREQSDDAILPNKISGDILILLQKIKGFLLNRGRVIRLPEAVRGLITHSA